LRCAFKGAQRLTDCYAQKRASDIGFKEDWLQEAIAQNPELVLGPCRQASFIPQDEQWRYWSREVAVKNAQSISIDVLLVSEFGRLGIVETKLFQNPEARRQVVAQALEYAIHLSMPDLPKDAPRRGKGLPFVELDDIQEKIKEPLIIIAGDELDPRAVKLSTAVIGKHIGYGWDLALVELAVFQQENASRKKHFLIVPHLAGGVAVEQRQVLLVRIEDKRTDIELHEPEAGPVIVNRRNEWTEKQFFEAAERAPAPVREFAHSLRKLGSAFSNVTFDFGGSTKGSLIMRKDGINVLEFYLGRGGYLRFRRQNDAGQNNFARAFGAKLGARYLSGLKNLFPRGMAMGYPSVDFNESVPNVLSLLRKILKASAKHSN
jgi:hypothetical protein